MLVWLVWRCCAMAQPPVGIVGMMLLWYDSAPYWYAWYDVAAL